MYLVVLYTSLSDLLDSASVDMGYVSRPSPYTSLAIYFGVDVRPPSPQTLQNIALTVIQRPEILRMSELNDSSELQKYSSAVLYVLSAVNPPPGYVEQVTRHFLDAISSSDVRSCFISVHNITLNTLDSPGAFVLRHCLLCWCSSTEIS